MSRWKDRAALRLLTALVPSPKSAPISEEPEKILVIRRNRIGDMVCTLPLLHALRKHYPKTTITVACDDLGAPIARASGVADTVYVLKRGLTKASWFIKNARLLQGYDIAIGVKAGFDRRLATLVRLTNAPVRIGYEDVPLTEGSLYYTEALRPPPPDEHQVDSCVKLLAPLGIHADETEFSLCLPDDSIRFAEKVLSARERNKFDGVAIVNISSTQALKLPDDVFAKIAVRLNDQQFLVAIAGTPVDSSRARAIADSTSRKGIFALETPGILDLAAVLQKSDFFFSPEGGAAHLAAALDIPALVFWSGGPFVKWHTRSEKHRNVHVDSFSSRIGIEELWPIIENDFLKKPAAKIS